MDTYKRFPLKLVKGKGCLVWDAKGNCYLDAVAGIATCSLGHSDNSLRRELSRQLNKLQHVSNLYEISEQQELANWLVKNSCSDKVFFCNSGAEANEAAIKLARKYGNKILGIDNPIIITANSSFHGRTLAALSATGQTNYHNGFEPMVKGFNYFDYNDEVSLNSLIANLERNNSSIAAVLIEPIQGEGGVNKGDPIFFNKLREICSQKKIMLIFDEVQTGMGRCGNWWGYTHLGIEPDVFTLAKGLGGGHAIGALLTKNEFDIFEPGDHASTFGGNPFACKAGLTVAKEIEKRNLISNAKDRGEEIKEGLIKIVSSFPNQLKEVRGIGLLQGLVLKEDININSQYIANLAINNNLLIATSGAKVIRIIPPLIITKRQVKKILRRLEETLESAFK